LRFINVPAERLDNEIEHALKTVLEFFQVDRAGLLHTLPTRDAWKITHAAYSEFATPVPVGTILPRAINPWAFDRLILIFPRVIKGGFMVGGQYGEGALFKNGKCTGFYNSVAASYGLQIGAQAFGYVLFLMTDDALAYLDKTEGLEIGVGPSFVAVDKGMARSLTTTTAKEDIYAFFFDQKGLMAGLEILVDHRRSSTELIDTDDILRLSQWVAAHNNKFGAGHSAIVAPEGELAKISLSIFQTADAVDMDIKSFLFMDAARQWLYRSSARGEDGVSFPQATRKEPDDFLQAYRRALRNGCFSKG